MTGGPLPEFSPDFFGPLAERFLKLERSVPLGPGSAEESLRGDLASITIERIFAGRTIADRRAAECCLSGLWLRFDFLHESHEISQSIETADGSYWHGIMHRREPDYGNAKYWFRRVGSHPIFTDLARRAASIDGSFSSNAAWNPYDFIDRCETAARRGKHDETLRAIAEIEWRLLFSYCYRKAIGE